jgi:DNA-binding beta-propeller fold protein YncE
VAVRSSGGGGRLARVDAGANQAVTRLSLRHPPTGLAIAPDGGTVWVATARDRSIRRVETRAGGAVARIRLPQAPDQAVFGDDHVWVTSREGDAVLRVDADTSEVEMSIRVDNDPSGIDFGADLVWVTNARDGTLSTINPQTNQVGTKRLGFRPAAVAVDQRAVWVALAP